MAYLFPHTAVPPFAAETLLKLFDELIVLQPTMDVTKPALERTEPNNRLKVQCPFETGHEQVNQAVLAYTKWAEQYDGTDLQQIKSQLDAPHFFDEESSYQLESLIRPSDGKAQPQSSFDPRRELLNSRIFLSLAQAFDTRNWEMEANLDQVEASEARLFAQLHGSQPEIDDHAKWGDGPQGSYMVRERMAAWSLFLTQLKVAPDVLVTLSPEVKPLIEEAVPSKDLFYMEGWVIFSDDASTQLQWREAFKTALDHWLVDPAKDQDLSELLLDKEPVSQKSVHIAAYRIRQCNPICWLNGPENMWDQADIKNSVVVLVQ